MKRFFALIALVVALLVAPRAARAEGFEYKPLQPLTATFAPIVGDEVALANDLAPSGLSPRHTIWNKRTTQVGIGLAGAGLALTTADLQTRSLRQDYLPTFRYRYDDYLQFAPAVAMVAMKALGVESNSSWGRMATASALSTGTMLSVVYIVKYGLGRLRPDGSTHNSFPSGHTAMAFTAASLLHKEYGYTLSPWVSVAGYTAATITGISRSLNNRHWLSDIVVGAGVGILSTEVGYWLTDKLLRGRGVVRPIDEWQPVRVGRNPSYVSVGIHHNLLPYDRDAFALATHSGIGFTLEGAWFFNSTVGVGVTAKVGRYANLVERELIADGDLLDPSALNALSVAAGVHLNHSLSERLQLGGKVLFGVGRNHELTNEIVAPDGTEVATISYDTTEHLTATAGLSLRYVVADNLGLRLYADYNYIRTDWDYTRRAQPEADGTYTTIPSPTTERHSAYRTPLSLGVAVDVMLW